MPSAALLSMQREAFCIHPADSARDSLGANGDTSIKPEEE